MKHTSSLLIALLVGVSFSAAAQDATRADQRQTKQQERIQQGVASGSLTEKEAARLEKGQARVQSIEDKANADGKVTRREAARIEHAQDVQSRRIEHQKHDRQHDRNHDGKKDRPRRK